jgi:hypothetical protein
MVEINPFVYAYGIAYQGRRVTDTMSGHKDLDCGEGSAMAEKVGSHPRSAMRKRLVQPVLYIALCRDKQPW